MRRGKDEVLIGEGQTALARVLGAMLLIALLTSGAAAQTRPGNPEGGRAAGSQGPLLLIEQTEIDLGQLPKGSAAEARFVLRNAGTADLRVREVKTGCACTVVTYDELIPPGEVGHVTVKLLTATLQGEVGQGISLMTNDPQSPATFLLVRGKVVTAVRILPDTTIELRDDARGAPVRRVIRRSMDAGHGFFGVGALKASAPWIDARARKVRQPEAAADGLPPVSPGDWILELRVKGQPTYGRKREEVQFKTGLDRQPLVKLDVYADLSPPVRLQVERLFLQPRGDVATEALTFEVRQGLDPQALQVEASPEGLAVEIEPSGGRAGTAQVRWRGGRLDDGKLTLRIENEQIEIPVVFAPGS